MSCVSQENGHKKGKIKVSHTRKGLFHPIRERQKTRPSAYPLAPLNFPLAFPSLFAFSSFPVFIRLLSALFLSPLIRFFSALSFSLNLPPSFPSLFAFSQPSFSLLVSLFLSRLYSPSLRPLFLS